MTVTASPLARKPMPQPSDLVLTVAQMQAAEQAVLLGHEADDGSVRETTISANELWASLTKLLQEIVPVAEASNVVLAMHPDDPPLTEFRSKARIMNSVAGFDRLGDLVPAALGRTAP